MAFSTLLATPFMKPFSSTISFARSASHLHPSAGTISPLITASDSDSDYFEAPILKGCSLKNPFLAKGRLVPYVVKDREDSFMAKVDLPGISKAYLRVWAATHFLHIKAEEVEDGVDGAVSDEDIDDEEEGSRKYFGSIPIPEGEYYKMDQIEAQMRNGVLKLVIPKLKLEEREDVINVIVNN
ncbi:heat shock 22 kDa protein, mitochondrial-like [Cornus florida]|uniref:heat shock 22 kDa protein, mitochondrial-like n=1 Tax=Cornus florida TaxID=4283 RepID=UPI0028968E72|nr:heat shock 22 kDa protein, mitochondrial-like [Cornus florida]